MFPRSSNCSAITNLSFPIKAESLQVHGYNSRATKILSFCIKIAWEKGFVKQKLMKSKNHMYKLPVTGYDALRYGNMLWKRYVHF